MTLSRYLPQWELFEFCAKEKIHLMAHQPLGGRPVAVVNPNAGRPGPMSDSDVSFSSILWPIFLMVDANIL